MKNFTKFFWLSAILLIVFANVGWGQTYYDMSSGNYSQTFTGWSGYATNWNGLGVLSVGSIPAATKTTTATNGTLGVVSNGTAIGYDATSSTKLVFLATGTTDNSTAVACDLNLNFTGRNAGTISFDAAEITNGTTGNRVSTLRLYYSIDGSTWTEIIGTNLPYSATNNVSNSTNISVSLPSALNNQGTVKLRFYEHNGIGGSSGSRPKISIDNVSVTSTGSAASTITTGIVSSPPFCLNASTSATGTVAYTSSGSFSSATFTANLSDATGSFTSPTSIGTASVTGTDPSGNISITIPAGTTSGTGYKIRIDCTSPAITGSTSSAFEIVNGANNVTSPTASAGNQKVTLSWTNPSGCCDEIMIVAGTSSISSSPSGNGSGYSASLIYGNGTSFGGGFVVYKGISSGQIVTSLTNGTTYYFKYFTRRGTDWSSGIEITSTPNNNKYAHSIITSWTTGPWYDAATGGNTVSSPTAGDNVFTNGNLVTVDADATCDNLTITNLAGAITVSDGITLTIRGLLDVTASVTNDVIGGTAGTIKFTGASLGTAPYNILGSNFTASAVFQNVTFSSGNINKELNTNSKRFKFDGTILVETGSVILSGDRNYSSGSNVGIITVNEGAQLTLPSSSFISGANAAGTKINSITVNGTFVTYSVFDATTLTIGTNGLLKTLKSGDFYSTAPTNFTCNGTFEYGNSGTQNIYGTLFNNLKLSGTSIKTLTGNATVNGTLTMGGTASLSLSTYSLTYGAASVLDYAGTSSQTTTDAEFPSLGGPKNCNISNTNGVTLNSDKTIDGTLTVKPNTIFDLSTFVVSGNGDFDVQNNATIKSAHVNGLNGNNITNGGLSSYGSSLNIEFNGTSSQMTGSYLPASVNTLTINNSAGVTLSQNTSVSGVFALSSGSLSLVNNTLTLNGTTTGTGTLTGSSNSNLVIGGTGDLGILNFTPGSQSLNNLTINRTSSGLMTLGTDLTINGTLTLTSGILNTKNGTTLNTLYFSNTATPFTDANETTNNRIVGKAIMNQRTVLAPNPLSFLGVTLQGTTESTDFTIERITDVDESFVSYGSYNGIRCKWHVSTAVTPTLPRNVTYKWLQALDNGNDFNSLNAQIWVSPDGVTWDRAGSGSLATGNPRSMQVSTTTFSFWSAADANTPLPVKLASTSTNLFNKRNIDVKWTTTSETNNAGFEIQRQNILENNWVKTGYVSGNGTTNNTKNYTFTDRSLMTGKYKYRLKQIDFNGNYEYFDINGTIEVGVPSKFDLSQNYPNPFNPVTKIDYDLPLDSKVTIKIFDITGREINTLINENLKAGYYTSTFNASNFSSGIYFYRLVTSSAKGSNAMTKKMMLIK
ncbi:MAG: T9SS type A sorting domain-containing protein [Ignavibacteria bacterium]|nr:T9SS type A sorting domain-containing protein [Ignavibacteria bacterium]